MKKFFAAILTVFLSLGLLTACGGGQQHGASSAPAVQSVERSDTGSADKSKSRIRQNKIYTDFDAVQSSEMLTKGARTKKKSVDKVTQAPRQFPKAVNNSAQKVRATRKSVWNGIRPTPIKIM